MADGHLRLLVFRLRSFDATSCAAHPERPDSPTNPLALRPRADIEAPWPPPHPPPPRARPASPRCRPARHASACVAAPRAARARERARTNAPGARGTCRRRREGPSAVPVTARQVSFHRPIPSCKTRTGRSRGGGRSRAHPRLFRGRAHPLPRQQSANGGTARVLHEHAGRHADHR